MTSADMSTVARLHRVDFGDGFYSRLGLRFIEEYLSEFVRCPGAVGLVLTDANGSVIGYLIGTVDDAAHHRAMYRRTAARLTVAGARALVKQPAMFRRFILRRSLWYARRAIRGALWTKASGGRQSGEVAYICVQQDARRHGHGSRLMDAYLAAARCHKTQQVSLVTTEDNHVAREFYAQRGWSETTHFAARDGRAVVELEFHVRS